MADVKLPKAESSSVDPDNLSQVASRAHKLAVAARLVAEMEAALAQFSDQVSTSFYIYMLSDPPSLTLGNYSIEIIAFPKLDIQSAKMSDLSLFKRSFLKFADIQYHSCVRLGPTPYILQHRGNTMGSTSRLNLRIESGFCTCSLNA